MKKISRICGALLISMLLSSILSGVVLVIMGTLNLPLDVQSIRLSVVASPAWDIFIFLGFLLKKSRKSI